MYCHMTVAYQQGSSWKLTFFLSGSYMVSLSFCLLFPSIQFSFPCLALFCPAIGPKQLLYSLTNKSNTYTEGLPTPDTIILISILHGKEWRDLNVTQQYIVNRWYSHDEYVFIYIMYVIIYIYKEISLWILLVLLYLKVN